MNLFIHICKASIVTAQLLFGLIDKRSYDLRKYDGIESIGYDECEHVELYRRFLESPERMIKYLFE